MKLPDSIKRWASRILSIVYGLLVLPGVLLALSAAFLFDAPGSETSIPTILFAFSLAVVPVILLVSCIGGLFCAFGNQSPKKIRWGTVFALLPVANLALIGIAIALLQILCNGSLVCHA